MHAWVSRFLPLAGSWVLLGATQALAQLPPYEEFHGDSPGDGMGVAVAGGFDLDNDGMADLLAGAYGDDNNGMDSGSARIFSGADGSTLYTFDGAAAGDEFGWSVAFAGDVNGDGSPDFFVGAFLNDANGTDAGSARVLSGADGSTLYTFLGDAAGDWFGYAVAGPGDVNADGHADLFAGARGDDDNGTDCGSARVLSGLDGSILYTFYGDGSSDWFGDAVAGPGDVDGDGRPDLLAGAPFDDNTGQDAGSARVLSGADGSILYTFDGAAAGDRFGDAVAGPGDVDGDGRPDLLAGAPTADNAGPDSGSARVLSGIDGSTLYTLNGSTAGDWFGFAVAGAGDVNADGTVDLLVGAKGSDDNGIDSGSARLFSGADGSLIVSIAGEAAGDNLGSSVCRAGDVDADGRLDIAAGAPLNDSNGSNAGSVSVYRVVPAVLSVSPNSGPQTGATPITVTGALFDGNLLTDHVDFVAPNAGVSASAAVTLSTPTLLQALSPVIPLQGCAAEALVDVRVTNTNGSGTLPGAFTYLPGIVPQGSPTLGGSVWVDIYAPAGEWALMIWSFAWALPAPSTWNPVTISGISGPIGWCTHPSSFLVTTYGYIPITGTFATFGPFTIPNNPSLLGLDMEFQSLVGPSLPSGNLNGSSFTNLAVMTIS